MGGERIALLPAVDFHVALPAFGPLVLRINGGADVKEFMAAEMGL